MQANLSFPLHGISVSPKQTAVNATTADLLKKQEELERKARELERRERELDSQSRSAGSGEYPSQRSALAPESVSVY